MKFKNIFKRKKIEVLDIIDKKKICPKHNEEMTIVFNEPYCKKCEYKKEKERQEKFKIRDKEERMAAKPPKYKVGERVLAKLLYNRRKLDQYQENIFYGVVLSASYGFHHNYDITNRIEEKTWLYELSCGEFEESEIIKVVHL